MSLAIVVSAAQLEPAPTARQPPMGWRSWNLFELNVDQSLLEQQIQGLIRRRHEIEGKPTSLLDLGYDSIGLDDGWQNCGAGVDGTFHDAQGRPMVNLTRFPDLGALVATGHSKGVRMGWYANNCWCNEGGDPKRAHYQQDADATVAFGFDAIKVDSCGPAKNISAWRAALDGASAALTGRHVELENCRNYPYTAHLTAHSSCPAELFRSTEDNAPDFLSIMGNLVTNARAPGSDGDVHGGLPVSHPGCWSYPDMLEIVGSGTCRQDLKPGTCGTDDPARRAGGLNANESRAHFGAWCIVSSPLVLGHDLADDAQYDAAWPIISNRAAIEVNQAWAGGDPGRLVAQSAPAEALTNLSLYHGAGCECVWAGQTLPRWNAWAKRLDAAGTEAAALAINLGDEPLQAGSIVLDAHDILGTIEARNKTMQLRNVYDIWANRSLSLGATSSWIVPELAPRSSMFVKVKFEVL